MLQPLLAREPPTVLRQSRLKPSAGFPQPAGGLGESDVVGRGERGAVLHRSARGIIVAARHAVSSRISHR